MAKVRMISALLMTAMLRDKGRTNRPARKRNGRLNCPGETPRVQIELKRERDDMVNIK